MCEFLWGLLVAWRQLLPEVTQRAATCDPAMDIAVPDVLTLGASFCLGFLLMGKWPEFSDADPGILYSTWKWQKKLARIRIGGKITVSFYKVEGLYPQCLHVLQRSGNALENIAATQPVTAFAPSNCHLLLLWSILLCSLESPAIRFTAFLSWADCGESKTLWAIFRLEVMDFFSWKFRKNYKAWYR